MATEAVCRIDGRTEPTLLLEVDMASTHSGALYKDGLVTLKMVLIHSWNLGIVKLDIEEYWI